MFDQSGLCGKKAVVEGMETGLGFRVVGGSGLRVLDLGFPVLSVAVLGSGRRVGFRVWGFRVLGSFRGGARLWELICVGACLQDFEGLSKS